LLLQFFPEDRPFLTDQELANLTTSFSTGVRKLAELWIVFYVTWLMQLLVNSKLGEDFSDDMMSAVYRRIATDEDRLPGIELIADGIKYWFKELDDGVREAITNPIKVRGEKLAAVHILAMRRLTAWVSQSSTSEANATSFCASRARRRWASAVLIDP
jgi:hypothetical protein